MTTTSSIRYTLTGTSFTLKELRAFLNKFVDQHENRVVSVSVHKGDRTNEPDTFSLAFTKIEPS